MECSIKPWNKVKIWILIQLSLTISFVITYPIGYFTSLNLYNDYPSSSAQRDVMRRQHNLVMNFEQQSSQNVRKGDSNFNYIPPSNYRQIQVMDLTLFSEEDRKKLKTEFTEEIKAKKPVFEDKEKIQALELALLEKGLKAICNWVIELPYPLDGDEQCTQNELKYILQSEYIPGIGNRYNKSAVPSF